MRGVVISVGRRFWWAWWLWALASAAQAEVASAGNQTKAEQYAFDTFGIELGLPGTSAGVACQTRDGYLWVGTQGGLGRFDGVRFVSFQASNTPAFVSHAIYCLYEDRDGWLWIGTARGVIRCRGGVFERIGLTDGPVRAIAQDGTGRVWIGTFGQGLCAWANGRIERYDREPVMPSPFVRSLLVDAAGRLWVGFEKGDRVVCHENGAFRYYDGGGVPFGEVLAICEQPRGTLWFGTSSYGLLRWKNDTLTRCGPPAGSTSTPINCLRAAQDGGLWVAAGNLWKVVDPETCAVETIAHVPSENIRAVCEDREGSVWLCAEAEGLIRMRRTPYWFISERDGLPGNGVKTVCEDRAGNIWLAVRRRGITKVAPDGAITVYAEKEGLPANDPVMAFAASDGNVWTGVGGKVCILRDGECRALPDLPLLRGVYEDRQGTMWLGTENKGLLRYKNGEFSPVALASGDPIPYATSFYEEADGTMYIGTWRSGLYVIKEGQIAVFNRENGLPADDVRDVYVDREKCVWVGLKSRGLAVRQNGRWWQTDALSDAVADHVTAIAEDEHGRLWLGTLAGVMWAPRDELLAAARGERPVPKMHVEATSDGGHVVAVWSGAQPAVWKTREKKLLFATRQGVLIIDPEHLPINPVAPPVHIEKITIDRRIMDAAAGLVIPAGSRELAIEYTAPSFVQPSRVFFRYKLEGYDTDWTEAGNRRTAFYNNLPPREYVFRVKACNSDGVWNERGDQIAVVQLPHFYETWWFYGGVFVGLAGVGWGLYRWSHRQLKFRLERLEQKQAMEKERRRIAKNLHDDLGANLTEIGLFAETVGRKVTAPEARQDMRDLSERVRGLAESLDAVVWAVNPANDSLDRLSLYICGLFQDLFRLSSIRCRLDAPGEIPPYALTPEERSNIFLTAKEAMNNVIKHSGATEAWLRIKMDGARYCLAIEDNGRGFDPAAEENLERNGLANMRSRIEDIKGTLTMNSSPGKGTAISISVNFAGRERNAP